MPKRFRHFCFFLLEEQVRNVRNAPHGVFKIKPRASRLDSGGSGGGVGGWKRPALIGCSQSGQLPGVIMSSGLNVKVIAAMGPKRL